MADPIAMRPLLYDPNVLQQFLQALGPYAGPAFGGLATAGGLMPVIGYAASPDIRQQMNQAALADIAALGGLGQQAYQYTVPGMLGMRVPPLEGFPARATPATPQRRGLFAKRGAPAPAPTPTPPPSRGPEDILKAAIALGAGLSTAPVLFSDVGAGAGAMRSRVASDWAAVQPIIQGMATSPNPVIGAVGRPVAGMAGLLPVPTPTPTPTPGATPTATPMPTATPTPTRPVLRFREEVEAMPDGAIFEVEGLGTVQRRGTVLYPMPAGPSPTSYPPGYQREYNGELWTKLPDGRWQVEPLR